MFALIYFNMGTYFYMFEQNNEKVSKILYTKYMENCEAMTSTQSFAYSYWLFKKCFLENYEKFKISYLPYILSDLHQIFIVLFEISYSFYWINLNLDRISPLIVIQAYSAQKLLPENLWVHWNLYYTKYTTFLSRMTIKTVSCDQQTLQEICCVMYFWNKYIFSS